ncbi:hypothetical protein QR680_013363 [Steinernema hermaphroditum]|uniref:RING-type domain-containing protein n=1 Tax=Steinernema hermaphroditum TaxID=289476 RepID=A0AA39I599_9BILA|nr:hypothetical protein QR680_013363 [Steinernema hermaphroditum]
MIISFSAPSQSIVRRTRKAMELAKCPVCLDLMAKPFVLGCGHSFCELCAAESVNVNDKCAVCRQPTRGLCAPNVDLDRLIRDLILPSLEPESRRIYEERCEIQRKRVRRKDRFRCIIWTEVERIRPDSILVHDIVQNCTDVFGKSEDVVRELTEIFSREILANDLSVFAMSETEKGLSIHFKEAFRRN